MLEQLSTWLVNFVNHFGYAGIFIMTFLESTLVPLPSEVTMIPAGYLIHKGEMNLFMVLLASVAGTLSGSYVNYWVARQYGRRFLRAYGRYLFFPPEKQAKLERYFKSHGEISIFTGRLIPGLRHFISIPAGLAHMDLRKFCIYTSAGGGIWMSILILVGYFIGGNKQVLHEYMPLITYMVLGIVLLMVLLYTRSHQKKAKKIRGGDDGMAR